MNTYHIAIIVGSLRRDSLNKSVARSIAALSVAGLAFEIIDLSSVPLFNQDLESAFPKEVTDLKEKIKAADGLIIVTPEYNRSIPGVLKNAIDWTSRPYGDNAWAGKPVAVAGASGGALGTALAQAHLKEVLMYLDTHVMGQPEIYIGGFKDKSDAEGNITDQKTLEFLKQFVEKFQVHMLRFKK
ncbi:MAG: NADPH-dependent reductase domain protein [Parcubacteria group bacterium]|nr:NADPH-dependent reductase domain protein [Parcubacteria group bacterium]